MIGDALSKIHLEDVYEREHPLVSVWFVVGEGFVTSLIARLRKIKSAIGGQCTTRVEDPRKSSEVKVRFRMETTKSKRRSDC